MGFGFTASERALLLRLKAFDGGADNVVGRDVATARRLEAKGLVTIADDGRLGRGGNADGERWTAELTDEGRALPKETLQALRVGDRVQAEFPGSDGRSAILTGNVRGYTRREFHVVFPWADGSMQFTLPASALRKLPAKVSR